MNNVDKFLIKVAINTANITYLKSLQSTNPNENWLTTPLTDCKTDTAIHHAVRCNQLAVVQFIVDLNPGLIDIPGNEGYTALTLASIEGKADIVDYLASRSANLNHLSLLDQQPKLVHTPLSYAVLMGHANVVSVLLRYQVDLTIKYEDDEFNIFELACKKSTNDTLIVLLENITNLIDVTSISFIRPLYFAAASGDLSKVKTLQKYGVDTICITQANNLMYICVASGSQEIALHLMSSGANFSYIEMPSEDHTIHKAAENGLLEVVQALLLKQSYFVNLVNARGQTPLILAAGGGHLDVVRHLANNNADLDAITNQMDGEKSAIEYATENGHALVVGFLLKKGAKQKVCTSTGRHLIHTAAANGYQDIVQLLVEEDHTLIDKLDPANRTPLCFAAREGHSAVVRYLLDENANLDIIVNNPFSEENGLTAYGCASKYRFFNIANAILLKSLPNAPLAQVLSHISHGSQALELMIVKPEWAKAIFADQRISQLMLQYQFIVKDNTVRYYKASGRRNSYYALINMSECKTSMYQSHSTLGRGGHGNVRLFKDEANNNLAVKSIHQDIPSSNHHQIERSNRSIFREAEMNRKAYPDALNEVYGLYTQHLSGKKIYSQRYLQEFVQGDTVTNFAKNLPSTRELAQLVLVLAREIQRINALGILHGDIHPSNVKVRTIDTGYLPHYIDFGNAYELSAPKARMHSLSSRGMRWYAPELYQRTYIKPHCNQDVYSFGYMLMTILVNLKLTPVLFVEFEMILNFICHSQHSDPSQRPDWEVLCAPLEHALNSAPIKEAPAIAVAPEPDTSDLQANSLFATQPTANAQPSRITKSCCVLQ